jgi:Tol biopolymer transport system component
VRAPGQLVPHDRWLTIETAHFRVHFPKGLEAEGRRGAVNAERAWAELSTELRAPKGKVDLVIADNVDFVNGYATPFPDNRIVIFANPPVAAPELRNYDDWSRLVITHELVHIFHLDRAAGIWRFGRTLLGRHPALFPNGYQPGWVIEGLAVYYESRITGAGRLAGSEHYMIARAAAEARRIPRIGELSRETSRFPGGEVVYAYGSQIFDHLARTRGPETIPKFLDVTSKVLLPLTLNRRSKRAFGISFENAWRDWRDSLVRVSSAPRDPLPGWRDLTREGRYVQFPRWIGDTALIYTASTGRDVTAAYIAGLDGTIERIGRRNSLAPNVRLPDGSIVFSQIDYLDPYNLRNDLYVERNGRQQRLTRGARLSHPDVRHDGEIVAVQTMTGTTRLVRVSPDGRTVRPITTGSAEVQWADPSWSPQGGSIAAVRIIRGGTSEIVVLDADGKVLYTPVSDEAPVSAPSWSPDGRMIYFTATRSGSSQIYVTPIGTSGVELPRFLATRLSSASTGVFEPELSPNQQLLAGLSFRFDGYHLGFAPMNLRNRVEDSVRTPRAGCSDCTMQPIGALPLEIADVPQPKRYSPVKSLLPKYWEPIIGSSAGAGAILGAATSGSDVIGRHSYYAEYLMDVKRSESEMRGSYQYSGLGQPYLNFSASQEWEHFGIFNNEGDNVGDLARRARIVGAGATLVRPRARTSASLSFGGDIETRDYTTDPDTLLSRLSETFSGTRRYPSVSVSAAWANTRRPALSISREDGLAASATVRQRWEAGDFDAASRSVIGVLQAYKSLDLPGFAHHVVALRGAAGFADRNAISTFSVGGLSGGSLDVLAGVSVGDSRRTFGLRGFPPSAEQGVQALAGTAEYRVPIAAPSRRVRFIPLLFDKISFSAFADAGRATCPSDAEGVCAGNPGGPWLASVGGELNLDTALQYDFPARFRLGVAVPVEGREAVGAKRVSGYLTIGSSF